MGKKFDMAALVKESLGDVNVSKVDTVQQLDTALIDANASNFYEMSDLEELAASIELVGLMHPVIVRPNGERYTLIDGERRFRAMTEVLGWTEIFAIVRRPANDVVEELMLIEANRTQRKMSAADLSRQSERYTELLAQLKGAGVTIPGRLRDRVAEALQVSSTKLARLQAIRGNLEPGLLELFDDGDLNESVAYELSKFDHMKQNRIWEALADANLSFTVENVQSAAQRDDLAMMPNPPKKLPDLPKPKPSDDSPVQLKPKDAYRRRTSIRDAASVLRLDPAKSIQENLEHLEHECRSWASHCGPGYDVSCRSGKIFLDEYTRYERRFTLRAFIELAAEMWIEADLPQVFAEGKPKPEAMMGVWYDADEGDIPDEDTDVADLIAWGNAGLTTIPGDSFTKAYAVMPERYRYWAIVYSPEEDA